MILLCVIASLFCIWGAERHFRQRELDKYYACITRLHACAHRLSVTPFPGGVYPRTLTAEFPIYGCDGQKIGYEVSQDRRQWKVFCKGRHHQRLGIQPNLPSYTRGVGFQGVVEECSLENVQRF